MLAYGRARASGPLGPTEKTGVLAATEQGLVFVTEDLFDVGEATLIPSEELGDVSREDGTWGAELRVATPTESWHFSRIDGAIATRILEALGRAAPIPGDPAPHLTPAEPPTDAATDLPTNPASTWFHEEPASAGEGVPTRDAAFPEPAPPPATHPARGRRAGVFLAAAAAVAVGAASFVWNEPEREPQVLDVAAPREPRERMVATPDAARIHTGKPEYASDERIEITFEAFPGNAQDWITVVPRAASERSYQEWYYLGGKRSGVLTFRALGAGEYEARGYFDWPSGGYEVRTRTAFRVSD